MWGNYLENNVEITKSQCRFVWEIVLKLKVEGGDISSHKQMREIVTVLSKKWILSLTCKRPWKSQKFQRDSTLTISWIKDVCRVLISNLRILYSNLYFLALELIKERPCESCFLDCALQLRGLTICQEQVLSGSPYLIFLIRWLVL